MDSPSTPQKQHFAWGRHLVIFLDVLGQQRKLRGLQQLPKDDGERAHTDQLLSETVGTVLRLRKLFQDQFQSFKEGIEGGGWGAKAKPLRPNLVGFSDLVVISIPLRVEDDDRTPLVRAFSALWASAFVMLSGPYYKNPLRGGIDVGFATEIGPNEIYGPALVSAYELECKKAQYPRIMIGDGLWNYLHVVRQHFEPQHTALSKPMTDLVDRIMPLIATDGDGNRILDYLGPVAVELAGQGSNMGDDMVRPAYEFVLAKEREFTLAGDSKLASRYASLRNYFESRLHLWNIPPSKS